MRTGYIEFFAVAWLGWTAGVWAMPAEHPASRSEALPITNRASGRETAPRARESRDRERSATANRQERDRWRQELRALPPAEREARLRELRQHYGLGPPARDERAAWRETWEKLSPAERQARLQAWRERPPAPMSLEERQARRQQLRERLSKHIAELRQRAAQGALTLEGSNRLSRLEEILHRFGRQADDAPTNLPPKPTHPPNP